MRDYMTLGSTPAEESCAQVGQDDYYEQSRKEGRAYIAQLKRLFGDPPDGARLVVKSFPHDFGSYTEVCVVYNDGDHAAVDYAYKLESDLPAEWDEEARKELGLDAQLPDHGDWAEANGGEG